MLAAPLVLARRWRGDPDWAVLSRPVQVLALVSAVALAVFASRIAGSYNGVVQRIAVTLPLAAELGKDHALGLRERLRDLYARGSVFITLLASVVVSALLPFWHDFFELWTHGSVPYDPVLTFVLLVGTSFAAPSLLALGYANYSNRGELLARTKGLQLAVFLVLSVVLIPIAGPLGAAFAVVASDVLVQFGLLGLIIMRQTLLRPFRHVAFLILLMVLVTAAGWGLGMAIGSFVPGAGLVRFVMECALWLAAVALLAAPLTNAALRDRLSAVIPR
jgi:O-antigen/teichoic acid export membrane protein